ncbi:hypothetical protein [Halobaculum marinum]|uniref:DNA replication complex GINS family protein n=1 Tax=Halobaculum marinum TaxID=3031996 RepID=A0ABD5WRZ2_9EURY|nr:hypothetical protein [Halobaculum sp. DT55]
MKFADLEERKQRSRRQDSLQDLPEWFYPELVEYLDGDLDERERRTAEDVADGLVDRRLGKIIKLASWEAADAPTDTSTLTDAERELYEDLVARMERFRLEVLAPTEGE